MAAGGGRDPMLLEHRSDGLGEVERGSELALQIVEPAVDAFFRKLLGRGDLVEVGVLPCH